MVQEEEKEDIGYTVYSTLVVYPDQEYKKVTRS
jgi:hypothetical protein